MTDRVSKIVLRGDVTDLIAKLRVAGSAIGSTVDKMTSAEKSAVKWREGLSSAGAAAGKVGLVAAAGLGAAVFAAANFDKAMSSVAAATHESTGNMELLREAAIKAGADTQFSATEAASAIEALAKAGVSTKDILGGGLTGALNLAAAGSLDVGQAAEIAATALTQFNLAGSDVGHVADLLAAAAGKAQGEVSDFGAALQQSGLVASQVGVSIEETTGALAAFASAGLIGSDAGTSFKTMLGALTPNSAKARKEMEALGISAYDAQGNFIGLAQFAGNLRSALKDMSDEQRQATLETIFGSDAVRAASVLYDQGQRGIQGWINKVDDQGFAAETAARKMDNLAGDVEKFTGSLETALIGVGEGTQGPLREMVQAATGAVNAFTKLPGPIQNTAGAMLAITAITGGGLWFGSKVIQGIADTRLAMDQLGLSAGKTRLALAGIGKGLVFTGVLVGLGAMDDALDKVFNHDLNESDLGRSLEALSKGDIAGTLKDVFGTDLSGFSTALDNVNSKVLRFTGVFQDIIPGDTPLDEAEANIRKLDEAMAGLVESGQGAQAARIFDQLVAAAEEGGHSVEDVKKQLTQYGIAVQNAGAGSNIFSHLLGTVADAAGKAGRSLDRSAKAQERTAAALRKSREAARGTAQSFVGLGNSLDNAQVSLNGWIRQMARQAKALRDFRRNAEEAANRGLRAGLIRALQDAGTEGALRMRQLAGATDSQIARANRAWQSGQREVGQYVGAIGKIPPSKRTNVVLTGVAAAESQLASLSRDRYARIITQVVGHGGGRPTTGLSTGGPVVERQRHDPCIER